MSGSNEERSAAAEEAIEPAAEMTAAEALAMATEAAQAAPEDSPVAESSEVEPAAEAEPAGEPETAIESESAAEPEGDAKPESTAEPEAADQSVATAEPEAATEPESAAEPEGDAEPEAAAQSEATAEPEPAAEPEAASEPAAEPGATTSRPPTDAEPDPDKAEVAKQAPPPVPDRPELRVVREAMAIRQPLEGRVIGWNNGGFHLALGDLSAFCPRSEMEIGEVEEPESYLDKTFLFRVLRLQGKGRRIVVSRAAQLRHEKSRHRNALRKRLKPGVEIDGTVASLTDFGAFVDLGGAQGLVHVSEISHRRVDHPSQVLTEGQEVRVKVLKVEQGGRRISLSIRALEPDPWKDLADRFPRGAVVKGTVEKANQIGAFIELAPGLTGLLPTRSMAIPRETNPARAYPPGKEVSVQIVSVDLRRQRIALALEGSGLEGSRTDYQEYKRQSREAAESGGFNALASAFKRLQDD